ncbi:hypothetical protein E5288_WYG003177 [Bos mutus]|uniref:Uncharacterized protein n=1 Tax=Bos mutus TaxID=72004 RepID=A0A6B0RBW7_9CETA|nr:hypothetical protein [Bos mutus]
MHANPLPTITLALITLRITASLQHQSVSAALLPSPTPTCSTTPLNRKETVGNTEDQNQLMISWKLAVHQCVCKMCECFSLILKLIVEKGSESGGGHRRSDRRGQNLQSIMEPLYWLLEGGDSEDREFIEEPEDLMPELVFHGNLTYFMITNSNEILLKAIDVRNKCLTHHLYVPSKRFGTQYGYKEQVFQSILSVFMFLNFSTPRKFVESWTTSQDPSKSKEDATNTINYKMKGICVQWWIFADFSREQNLSSRYT